jgi:hypothetical protein
MTDDPTLDNEDSPGRLRQMYEDAARERAALAEQLSALQRKDVFRDAGLDLSNRQHQAFAKAYDGDLTTEAVQGYVADLGITAAPEVPSTPPDEAAAHQRMAQAAAGDGTPPPAVDHARLAELRTLMDQASRNRQMAELDRLTQEYAVASGTASMPIQ